MRANIRTEVPVPEPVHPRNTAPSRLFGKGYLWPPSMRTFLFFLLLLASGAYGQDRILLMNGQTIQARVLGQSTLEVRYQVPKGARLIERSEPTESVFSVTDSLGEERVWYFMDTVFGNDYSVDQIPCKLKVKQTPPTGNRPIWPMNAA